MKTPDECIRIILVDDHTLVRLGFRSIFEKMENVEIVGEASDGHEALRVIEQTKPDIVFMDVTMKGLNGIDALIRISQRYPKTRVLMLSMHATEEYIEQSLTAGAAGYMLKDAAPEELRLAIRAVTQGNLYLSPSITRHVVDKYIRRLQSDTTTERKKDDPYEILTLRQREILQLIAEGLSTKEIAAKLNLSTKTVETHRAQIMDRLDIHDTVKLSHYAMRVGLVNIIH